MNLFMRVWEISKFTTSSITPELFQIQPDPYRVFAFS